MPMRVHAALAMISVLGAAAMLRPADLHALSTAQQELAAARSLRPSLDRGAELYLTCAACHGEDGGGTADGQVPRIAGQHASVLQKQLVDFRHDRRWDVRMEHFADRHHLSDAQAIADVSAYISRLGAGRRGGTGDEAHLPYGAQGYAQLCASCHGAAAEGSGERGIPRLAGQHYEYLRRQIYDAADGRRPNFSTAHIRLLAHLDHEQIAAIADYLSRLPGAAGGSPASRQ